MRTHGAGLLHPKLALKASCNCEAPRSVFFRGLGSGPVPSIPVLRLIRRPHL
jgi:hypothetical protein